MLRENLFVAVILILMSSVTFAYWSEKIDVYAIGLDGRGLSNATVSVVYQGTQCGYHNQLEKQTDAHGFVHFEFMNTVDETFNATCVEHSYTIIASLAGFSNSTIGYLNNTEKSYFISLPVLQHELVILDSSNRTLANANVVFDDTTFSSGNTGTIFLSIPFGTLSNVTVNYGGVTRTLDINPSYSNITTVTLPVYDLKVKLFNDQGVQINGTVTSNGIQELSTTNASALFPLFAEESPQFIVNTSGKEKVIDTNITSDVLNIYFDLTPPSIRDVKTEVTGRNDLIVTASISDPGLYPSGLKSNPALGYSLGPEGGYTEVKMYPASAGKFETTIPANGANLTYRITATDNQNNFNTYSGSYNFSLAATEAQPTTQIAIIPLIGIIVFIVVVIFIYQRIRGQF